MEDRVVNKKGQCFVSSDLGVFLLTSIGRGADLKCGYIVIQEVSPIDMVGYSD